MRLEHLIKSSGDMDILLKFGRHDVIGILFNPEYMTPKHFIKSSGGMRARHLIKT